MDSDVARRRPQAVLRRIIGPFISDDEFSFAVNLLYAKYSLDESQKHSLVDSHSADHSRDANDPFITYHAIDSVYRRPTGRYSRLLHEHHLSNFAHDVIDDDDEFAHRFRQRGIATRRA